MWSGGRRRGELELVRNADLASPSSLRARSQMSTIKVPVLSPAQEGTSLLSAAHASPLHV